jgi:hypothetical protein
LAPVAKVRCAGADRYWDGCHEFGRLSPREAARTPYEMEGPLAGELGASGQAARLAESDVATAFSELWPFLQARPAAR